LKISVITPTLNSAKYIKSCLQSVEAQKNCIFEHIIVDGGSVDETVDIVLQSNATLYIMNKSSIYEANNFGIQKATGDIVCFLNSDDYYQDAFSLSKVCEVFKMNAVAKVLYGNVLFVDNNGHQLYRQKPIANISYSICKNAMYIVPHSSTFFKMEVFDLYGKYDEALKYSADLEYILTLLKNNVNIFYVDYDFSTFCRHDSNRSSDVGASNEFYLIAKKHGFSYLPLKQKLTYLFVNVHNFDYLCFILKRRLLSLFKK